MAWVSRSNIETRIEFVTLASREGSNVSELVIREDAFELAFDACRGAGAGEAASRSLAAATVSAERQGKASVGFAHLVDYLDAFAAGRIAGDAAPVLSSPAGAIIACDARGGIAQLGFDLAFADLHARCAAQGVAIFAQHNSYTAGELGYYVRRLAEAGLVALAATNGPALMTPPGGLAPVYCTNPIAFAAPVAKGPPLVIDQAGSATAFVNVRDRAGRGEPLPSGWAIDAEGRETTDASAAMRGALLTFGGARGANIALMVEVLAAGLTGANWSLDAPSFVEGSKTPGAGLFIAAIAPDVLAPDFAARLESQLARLAGLGVHIPGRRADRVDRIEVSAPVLARIRAHADRRTC
jgi:(2R)-3-sulfolactate dehydrogenase (NADP+)